MENDKYNRQPWTVFRDGKELLRANVKSDLRKLAAEGKLKRDDLVRDNSRPDDLFVAGSDTGIFADERPKWTVFRDGKELLTANAKSDLHKLAVGGELRHDDLIRHKDRPDDWVRVGSVRDIFPYDKFSPPNASTTPHPFLDEFKVAFEEAMNGIDKEAKQLVEARRDYQAIRVVCDHWETIRELWSTLSSLYVQFQRMRFILEHFDSERLRQLGQDLPDICRSFEEYERDPDEVEARVLDQFGWMGIPVKSHWFIDRVVVTEFYLMLDILRVLIEPDYVPLEDGERSDESQDRYIAPSVKRAVWRRDGGKCVECGSRDKLEYDHIIPVSKGGSNTERNVQLLCEKCNRTKAAQIG